MHELITNPRMKRLRWVAMLLIAVDAFVTIMGQPAGFWSNPGIAREANPLFAWFLLRGLPPFILILLCYAGVVFYLVSVLPRRLASIALFSVIFGHYFGASSWLMFNFHLGIFAPIVYGILLSICLVALGEENLTLNQPPLRMPVSGTPAADAPVAPPPGIAGR